MSKVDQILSQFTAHGSDTKDKILGAAFVVTDKNGVIYSGSSGRIDFPETSAPFTDKSFSWIASLTKLLTSTCVLQLVEQKKLTLDEDLRPKIPEFRDAKILVGFNDDKQPVMEENPNPITLRQLLTHTAGFGYEFTSPDLLRWARNDGRNVSKVQWNKKEITTPLAFAPGEGWAYGVNTDWAGQVLEHITGQTLGQYMQEHIFTPLGMADTSFWPGKVPQTQTKERKTKIAMRNKKTGLLEPTSWDLPEKHETESGGGGLFSTAADYARVLQAHLQGRLLKPETMKEMLTPQLNEQQRSLFEAIAFAPTVHNTFAPEFTEGTELSHGLAGMLNLHDVPGKRRALSVAWSGMHNSRWWLDPKTGIAAVLLVNVRPHGDTVVAKLYDQLEFAVYKELLPLKGKM